MTDKDLSKVKVDLYLIIIFGVSSLVVTILNLKGPYIINFINESWPINVSYTLYNLFHGTTIYNYGNLSFIDFFNLPPILLIYLLYIVKLPTYIQEIIIITLLQIIAMYFTFKICEQFIFKGIISVLERTSISIISSILIVFSFSSQALYWFDFIPGGLMLLSFGAGTLYYELKIYEDYMQNKLDRINFVLFFIFSSLSISTNTPINLSLILLMILLPLYVMKDYFNLSSIKKYFIISIMLLVLSIFSNLWYIIPTLMEGIYAPFSSTTSTTFNMSVYLSAGKLNPLQLFFFTFPTGSYSYPSLSTSIFKSYGILISYFETALIFAGLISVTKNNNKSYYITFVIYIFIYLMVIGSGGPFNPIYLYVFSKSSTFFVALRNPYNAFVFAQNMIFIFLIIYSIWRIKDSLYIRLESHFERNNFLKFVSKRNKAFKNFLVITSILLVTATAVIPTSSAIYLGQALPSSPLKSTYSIPQYESETASYLSTLNSSGYIYLFPGGGIINQTWKHGYEGFDILPNLIGKNLVIDSPSNAALVEMCQIIRSATTYNYQNFASGLSDLGIEYLVIEGNISYTKYWSYTYTPSYSKIYKSLNQTSDISLIKVIGTNYIYKNDLNATIFYIPKTTVSQDKEINDISTNNNITLKFYNDMHKYYAGSPSNFINSTNESGTIHISVNSSERNYINKTEGQLPFSYQGWGGPSVFNQYPLNISTEKDNYLIIKFSTNSNAAITLSLISANRTKGNDQYGYYLAQNKSIVSGFGSINSLVNGDSKLNPTYGGGWVNVKNKTTMIIDLKQSGLGKVNKLLFSILPVFKGGFGNNNVPITKWPKYENLTIYGINIGDSIFFNNSPSTKTIIPTNLSLNLNSSIIYKKEGCEVYSINIREKKGSLLPIPIVMTQNFENGWTYCAFRNIAKITILNENYSTLIIVYPTNKSTNLSFAIEFSGNKVFNKILILTLLIYFLPLGIILSYSKIKSRIFRRNGGY